MISHVIRYCADCGKMTCTREDPDHCAHCGSANIERDPDVLDTWFSSALWPFSTLGWPNMDSEDLKYFYPTDVLVTGYDIITFWVSRMIVSGLEHMGKAPFHTVFIHGLVRDDKGRKMSKSLGNGIDPLEMADKFGADALRFNLITGNAPGNDMRFYVEKCEAMRNFANKIWNASRFVMMNLTTDLHTLPDTLEQEDKWILCRLGEVINEVTENMESYELGVASAKVYDFIWSDYCDWYIELTKARLQGEDETAKENAQRVLVYVLSETLKLLHPFMPFITEEIWQALPHEGDFLMLQSWPKADPAWMYVEAKENMEAVMDVIRAIRARRAEMNVPPSKKAALTIVTNEGDIFAAGEAHLKRMAWASSVEICAEDLTDTNGMVCDVTHMAKVYLPLAELVDIEKEKARLTKDLGKKQGELKGLEGKLSNPGFLAKAPENVVAAEQERAEKLKELIKKIEEQLNAMG